MTDETKPAAAAEAPAEPTRAERIEKVLADYAHALEHAAPRSTAELAEIKSLLSADAS